MVPWAHFMQLLDRLPAIKVGTPEGQVVGVKLNDPLSNFELKAFEAANGLRLPEDFREFYRKGNGGNVLGMTILPLNQWTFVNRGLINFHDWGERDFTCLDLRQHTGTVVFVDQHPRNAYVVRPSFSAWLDAAVKEIEAEGRLRHPKEYDPADEQTTGVYRLPAYWQRRKGAAAGGKHWWAFWR